MTTTQKLTVEKNDPRLCLAGTEHLWTVCMKTRDKLGVSTEVLAENVVHEDAVLFAAAPELLAAVCQLRDYLQTLAGEVQIPSSLYLQGKRAMDAAESALSKAEGRDS